jgi:hypothetical protein
MRGEEEHWLDQLKFHQAELVTVDNAIDACIQRGLNRLKDSSG